jgi:hypothetical protein
MYHYESGLQVDQDIYHAGDEKAFWYYWREYVIQKSSNRMVMYFTTKRGLNKKFEASFS